MKYVRIRKAEGSAAYGILRDGMIELINGTPFDGKAEGTGEFVEAASASYLAPVPFSKAVCIGLNYRDHAEEFGLPIPETPVVFMKPSTAAAGYGDDIIYPAMCHRLDYEAELAVVIGRECHMASEKDALDYVLGYTIANDVTARDLQPKNGQWTIAKKPRERGDEAGIAHLKPYLHDSLSYLISLACNDAAARRCDFHWNSGRNIRDAERRHSGNRDRGAGNS